VTRVARVGVHDNVVLAVTIVLLVAICVTGVALFAGLRWRRRLYRGPARDAWELTRRDLNAQQQWHVRRSTAKRRPVSRGRLAPAQLVYTRYSQYVAENSPAHRRWFLVGYTVLCLAVAAAQFVNAAITQHAAGRWFDVAIGCYWVFMAGWWAWWMRRWLARHPQRMKQLRRDIRQQWPDDWA
jgi:O-antigen/teichoic acid export membrane protein